MTMETMMETSAATTSTVHTAGHASPSTTNVSSTNPTASTCLLFPLSPTPTGITGPVIYLDHLNYQISIYDLYVNTS